VRGRPQGARGWELEPTAHDGREQGARWGEHAAAVPPVRRRARPAGAAGGFRRGRGSTGAGPRARLLGRGAEQSVGRADGSRLGLLGGAGSGHAGGWGALRAAGGWREVGGGGWVAATEHAGKSGAAGLQARESPVAAWRGWDRGSRRASLQSRGCGGSAGRWSARVSRAASGAAALVAGAAAGAAAQAVVGLVSDPAGAGVPGRGSGSPGGARRWGRREEKRSRRLAAGREEGEGSRRLGQGPAAAVEGRPKPNLIPCRIVKPNPYPKQGWE
jgi:hypothetical protein